jgi:nucleoside-diphosphate-sugar epimerase
MIMNCAASIDFNARIDNAIDINIRGSLRMLELARKAKRLEMFTHVSTCYANCDRSGLVKEEIYERGTLRPTQNSPPRRNSASSRPSPSPNSSPTPPPSSAPSPTPTPTPRTSASVS